MVQRSGADEIVECELSHVLVRVKIAGGWGKTMMPGAYTYEKGKARSHDPVPPRSSKAFATKPRCGKAEMSWRLARLDIEAALSAEPPADCGPFPAAPAAAASSFFLGLKQRFCSDEELVDQSQNGNADALGQLFGRHSPLLFAIARRILRSDTDAEDAVQQIFLDVFRSIRQFDPEKGTFKTWLLMFAYHRTFNSRRSQIARRLFDTDPLEEGLPGLRAPDDEGSRTENSILVSQVLESLQPRQRRTIELVYYEGLTAEEVSIRTGESVRVVRHNLYRGLDKLRKAFRTGVISPLGGGKVR
jgi:RNA polymerase sigma-70 factor (ECF subfamily)